MKRKIKDNLIFGINFLRSPLKNASIVPSSIEAGRAMLKGIDFSKIETIVELGPGTGIFTEEIIKRCKFDSKIILIEIEKTYIKILREKFGSRVVVENTSAHMLDEILEKHGIEKLDLIVSGLPFIQDEVGKKIFGLLKKHTDQGTIYRFFTYFPPIMKHAYKDLDVKKKAFVRKNIPPLWIYGIN